MHTALHWIAFNVLVLIAIALDLGVFHRKAHKIALREALLWSFAWIGLAIAFGLTISYFYGRQSGLEFFTGYVIEKALSVDNLFVFLVVFRVFAVKEEYQQRVLGYGILGALLMRGAMIAAGAALIERFNWIMYVFGAFIIYAGLHMLFAGEAESHPEQNFLVRYLSRHLRLTKEYRGEKFFSRENGRLFATPLFLVLLIVEITDVTFAIDSIPAVFGITRDTFIVYTSNVFAILGLRALYFLLAGVLDKLDYLKVGLALVLVFVGAKMIVEPWLHISVGVSLAIVLGMLMVAVLASLLRKKKSRDQSRERVAGQ
ncbi:MAG TPA: TerC family protein [Acidobacteriota bacterium]|nr:TerC family protein [Acidobacteriota bacterium]